MPIEIRDPKSGAKLFIPTTQERADRNKARELDKQLEEVEVLKQELMDLIKQAKK